MLLVSSLNLNGSEYYLVMKNQKTKSTWYLYSVIHPDDFLKTSEEQNKRLFSMAMLSKPSNKGCVEYCVESMEFVYNKPKSFFGRIHVLNDVIDAYSRAKTYGYTKSEVITETSTTTPSGLLRNCVMQSESCHFSETRLDNMITSLSFSYGSVSIDCLEYSSLSLPSLKYKILKDNSVFKSSVVLSINDVRYETLREMIDLSWYEDSNGNLKKDYTHISNHRDFEVKVIYPMIKEILRCKSIGEKCLIGLDTETTGLMVKFLRDDNPIKDHIVSTQLSWKFDQGVNIYLDMAYFENCDINYVLGRLAQLFRWDHEEFEFELFYDEHGNENHSTITLDRNSYLVGGHNFPFDSQAIRSHGYEMFFDVDTLQMAFTIAPTSIKVKKGLKQLTRKLLGIESPELVDILGKGNEDKFRYLRDTRVADIYGCADVDMFRYVYYKLKDLMGEKLYKAYERVDVYLCNVLAESEYYGVRFDKDYVIKEADHMEKDLKILEETIYQYVGKMLLLRASASLNKPFTQEEFESASHRFKITGNDLLNVTYNYLQYPVKVLTNKGKPALNSYAIDKLLYYKNPQPANFLVSDILSSSSTADDPHVLISAEKFNSYRYPLCYLLKEYRVLSKEYTGYYKPFKEIDTEGRIFKSYRTNNIETRRISNPLQTVKKNLKKCILSHGEDWNLGDWDLAQIELRMFTSLAKDQRMIDLMMDGDVDFHTENGALIYDVPAHLLAKSDRSKAKSVGFGVPYGLSARALCEWMFTEVTKENLLATYEILDIYERKNHLSMDLLKSYRAKARELAYMSPELRDFLEIDRDAPVAMIHNANGFYRYQDMTNILGDNGKLASVERAFGNFPIQSFAADYFKMLICRLDKRLRKEGLKDKFIIHMTIHDEILFSFHKSLDPNLLANLIKEECMLRIKGHTNYFLGLNFGKSWYECKQDAAELPVKFLVRNCKAFKAGKIEKVDWCDSPAEYFKPKVFEFKKDRIIECLGLYEPDYNKCLNLDELLSKFANYTVRSYFYEMPLSYTPKVIINKKGEKEADPDDRALSSLLAVLKERNVPIESVIAEGKTFAFDEYLEYRYSLMSDEEFEIDLNVSDNLDDEFEEKVVNGGAFWSFDDDEDASDIFFYKNDEIDEFDEKVKDLLAQHTDKYMYIENIGATKVLVVKGYALAEKLEAMLQKYKDPHGTRVSIDYGGKVVTSAVKYKLPNDDELEKLIGNLHDSFSGSSIFG